MSLEPARICLSACLITLFLCICVVRCTRAATHHLDWKIQYTNVTRLCHSKSLVSVNGQFPGPTTYVREGDTVIVNVTNLVSYNITIHWHGVRQLLSAWADGPVYATQCPIQTGHSYVHRFKVTGQRGTLFWHAHTSWLRATVYGAFIILPPENVNLYPFPMPTSEFPILLGEWWNANVEDVIEAALASGTGYNISDAFTINGQPGDLFNCSQAGTTAFSVTQGGTYLLRVINAAVNFQLYFGVAGHNLTVVEIDAAYTKPYNTSYIVLAPGQTTNVLLTANQPRGQYYMAASVFSPTTLENVPFGQTATTAILNYVSSARSSTSNSTKTPGALPAFPAYNDAAAVQSFAQSLRSLSSSNGYSYMDVPQKVEQDLFFTLGFSLQPCPAGKKCKGPSNEKLSATINNVTFVHPSISILQAYYNQINNVYKADFPDTPAIDFNYTETYVGSLQSVLGTRVKVLDFNQTVQIVFQDTSLLFFEGHPMHLHGHNFYVVGSGLGTYDASSHSQSFNLVDPPSRNTVSVPAGGWTAIRFRATNPGVWYMHCHIDLHNSWGMAMAFITKNGNGPTETLPPPPEDLPSC